MEDRMRYALAMVAAMLLLAGCSDKGTSISPQEPQYSLSGLVINQNGSPVVGMEIKLRGQHGLWGVWRTRQDGSYGGGVFRADSIAITYGSDSADYCGVPHRTRFIPFSTTLWVDNPRIYDVRIREFLPIFQDPGHYPSGWYWHNARHDSTGYTLYYVQGDTTFLKMSNGYPVRENASNLEFLFYGQTFPSGQAEIAVTAEVNGQPVDQEWRSTFGPAFTYSQFSLEMLDSLPGCDIQLAFTFHRVSADSIRLSNFWIYGY